jgi:hypothetical protein
LFLALMVASLLPACGDDTCDKVQTANFGTKVSQCPNLVARKDLTDKAACQTDIKTCNDDDKDKIATYANCVQGVSLCEPGTESSFEAAINACASPLDTLSSACTFGKQ